MPFTVGRLARITLPCTQESYVVQGTRRPSKCSAKQTKYDIPKFSSPVAIENNCEEHTFVVPRKSTLNIDFQYEDCSGKKY